MNPTNEPAPRAYSANTEGAPRKLVVGLFIVLGAQLFSVVYATSHSGFLFDDFINFWLAREYRHVTWGYLTRDNFGHLAVFQRLIFNWVFKADHAHWRSVVGWVSFFNLLASYTAFRLATVIVGSSRWAVAAAAACALSPLWAGSFWFAAAADTLIALPLVFIALELALRRIQGGSRLYSLGAAGVLGLSLLSRERPAVLPGAIALLVVAIVPSALTPRTILRAFTTTLDLWLSFLLTLSGYAVFIFTKGELLHQMKIPGLAASGPLQVGEYISKALSRVILPSLVGIIPHAWDAKTPVRVAADLAALAGLAGIICAFPRGWRIVVFLFGSWVLSLAPVGLGRGGAAEIFSIEVRYGVELLPFICLAVALLGREARAGRIRPVFSPALNWFGRHRAGTATVGFLVVAYAALSFGSMARYQEHWNGGVADFARRYRLAVDNLTLPSQSTLLDVTLTQRLNLLPLLESQDWAQLSMWLAEMRPKLPISNPDETFVHQLDSETLAATRFRRSLEHEDVATADLKILNTARAVEGNEVCLQPSDSKPARRVLAPLSNPPAGASAVLLEVEWRPGRRPFWIAPGSLGVDGTWTQEAFAPAGMGAKRTAVVIPLGREIREIGLEIAGTQQACIRSWRATPLARL